MMRLKYAELSRVHKVAFSWSWKGIIGSSFVWRLAYFFNRPQVGNLFKLPNGIFIHYNPQDWTAKTIYEGTYERGLLKILESCTFTGPCIDVGANIGSTLTMALKNSESASYIAFEPSNQCFSILQKVSSLLPQEGEIIKAAVGSTDETRNLFDSNNPIHSGAASLLNFKGLKPSEANIKVVTLDNFLIGHSKVPDPHYSLLKIDTEGYENEVIAGAVKILSKLIFDVIVIEVSPNFGEVKWVKKIDEILGSDYNWYQSLEHGLIIKKPKLRKISPTEAQNTIRQFNLVLIRQDVVTGDQSFFK